MSLTAYDNTILATAGLVHYYPLNEASGAGTAVDAQGSSNGTNTGITAGVPGGVTDGSTAYSFTGSAQIDLGAPFALGTSNVFSVEFWFKFASLTGTQCLYQNGSDSHGNAVWLNGTVLGQSVDNNSVYSSGTLTTGVWHHCVVTFGTSARKIYIDGVATSYAIFVGLGSSPSGTNFIGRWNNTGDGPSFAGSIQKVAYYNVELSSATVAAHYAAGTTRYVDGWGDSGTGGGLGTFAEPYTLTGTSIVGLTSPMHSLAARVHRRAYNQRNDLELWYFDRSDGNWYLFPSQPVMTMGHEPVLTWRYREPATLDFNLLDNQGLSTPENLNSPHNYNQLGDEDPLVDEARKIVLREGCWCFYNSSAGIAPTSTLAPSAGLLSALTDGILGDVATSTTAFVEFAPTSATAFDLLVDLGSLQQVHHVVIRFGSKIGTCTLPAAVTWSTSPDGINWKDQPRRPVGGAGGAGVATGDWDDDYDGVVIDVIRTDIEQPARYVRFRILPTGAQTIAIDELAVYAGGSGGMLGRNVFTGYLGDKIQVTPEGFLALSATDVLKKLADNNEVRLTPVFQNQDVGDIAWVLLTQGNNWRGSGTAYDAPFDASEVGWASGSKITGLLMPVWQNQGNNMLGYVQDLFHEVGFLFYADGNGVLQVLEPPFKQRLPDRVCIADIDGNHDVRDCVRDRAGKDLRNVVEVSSSNTVGGGASSLIIDPNSAARYGHRRVVISDPVATTKDLRQVIGEAVLRDYRYRLQTLQNAITPDFDTQLKQIWGFRAPARPHLFAKAGSVTGDKRLRELWSLDGLTMHICPGQCWADANWIPYVPGGPDPPLNMVLSSPPGSGEVIVSWDAVTDPHAAVIRGYLSTTNEVTGFTQEFQVSASTTTATITGLTNGVEVWVYLTTIDDQGQESIPGSVVAILVGGGSASSSGWAVTDLSAGYNSVEGPGPLGNYTYEFNLSWTAPANGCKRWEVYYSIGALPTNPADMRQWKYQDEFHGAWQPSGTPLAWYPRIQVHGALASGSHVYFRLLTSDRNTSDGGVWPESNIDFVTIP